MDRQYWNCIQCLVITYNGKESERIDIYALSYFAVHLKVIQHCKLTIIQYKEWPKAIQLIFHVLYEAPVKQSFLWFVYFVILRIPYNLLLYLLTSEFPETKYFTVFIISIITTTTLSVF